MPSWFCNMSAASQRLRAQQAASLLPENILGFPIIHTPRAEWRGACYLRLLGGENQIALPALKPSRMFL